MNSLWRLIRTLMAIAGGICVCLAVSTSDYYVIELEVPQPSYINKMIIVGLLMMLPALISMIYNGMKEKHDGR